MSPDEETRLRRLVRHEAAHAVVASVLRVPVRHVLVDWDAGRGEVPTVQADAFVSALISVAGEAAVPASMSPKDLQGTLEVIPEALIPTAIAAAKGILTEWVFALMRVDAELLQVRFLSPARLSELVHGPSPTTAALAWSLEP